MQESNELDNSQAIRDLGWLAGVLDGEGSVILGVFTRKNNTKQYFTRVCFYNSDEDVVNKVVKILDKNDIPSYTESRLQYGNLGDRKGFTVTVGKQEAIVKLLGMIKNDLTCKKTRAELLTRFCESRLKHQNKTINEEESDMIDHWNNNIKIR
jgi:hypothetical protein